MKDLEFQDSDQYTRFAVDYENEVVYLSVVNNEEEALYYAPLRAIKNHKTLAEDGAPEWATSDRWVEVYL